MKIAGEHKEKLQEIVEAGQWPAVLAVVNLAVLKHEEQLRSCKIDTNSRDLLLRKARLEGVYNVKNLFEAVSSDIASKD